MPASVAIVVQVTNKYIFDDIWLMMLSTIRYGLSNFGIPPSDCTDMINNRIPHIATATPAIFRPYMASPKNTGAIIQLDTNENTPSGDTIDAGANPYAKKLPVSPTL